MATASGVALSVGRPSSGTRYFAKAT
ncbi:MAG: hypothetical protein RIR52_2658, partial [Acidobacteriota bacterium]